MRSLLPMVLLEIIWAYFKYICVVSCLYTLSNEIFIEIGIYNKYLMDKTDQGVWLNKSMQLNTLKKKGIQGISQPRGPPRRTLL